MTNCPQERDEGLVVTMLPDDKPGLDHIEALKDALWLFQSNGGDTRCLCSACIMFWALRHIERLEAGQDSPI